MKTFKEVSEQSNALLVVDSLNLAFRYRHTGVRNFAEDYLRTVQSLKKSYKASKVIIAADQGSSSFRKALHPLYKQNRKDKFEQQTEDEKLAFEQFFEDFTKTLEFISKTTDYPILKFPGVEADDICAYIAKKVKDRHIWLISSDKDYDLLISPNVSRFSYVTRKEITWDNWNEHYEYNPDDHISIKCLTGDSGDNIPGVAGIGPKKALSLVREYGSTYDIIANIPISSRYKYIQNLNEFGGDALMLNYKLMDLLEFCDEALGEANCRTIDQTLQLLLDNK